MSDGGLIQFVYEEFDDPAYIDDAITDFEMINQTALTITTKGNSFLSIRFVMQAVISVLPTFVGPLQIEIALVVSGIGNRTLKVAYYLHSPLGEYHEQPADVTIDYVTNELTRADYTVSVWWKSTVDSTGVAYLLAHNPPNLNNSRSLLVEEIRV
jgi:hypothetical protein